jgi:hypothetical protein
LLCADFGVLVTSLCCFSSVGIGWFVHYV